MARVLASIFLAVELGGGFGTATAEIVSTTSESVVVELEVEVEMEPTPDSVVAHFVLPDEYQITIALLPRGEGIYGVTTELKPANYQVVFEALGETSSQSDPVSLSDLGADLGPQAGDSDEEDESSPETNRWLWLGVALGAASLSALAFWVLGARDEDDGSEDLEAGQPSEGPLPDETSSEAPAEVGEDPGA
jgi:hypothetical protein